MARIRTIKPEFWTDEVIVKLPYEARLLFIGLWNFADDEGCLMESPDRIRLQLFPDDVQVQIIKLLDLLVASGLLDRFVDEEGNRIIKVHNWSKHQKVDNPSKSRILSEKYRKLAIPSEARRAVAIKYGCQPGGIKAVACYFCGASGTIWWFTLPDGRPTPWVAFDLELDHFQPEAKEGPNSAENLVLSCRQCNRGRRDRDAIPWIVSQRIASPREASGSPRGSSSGMEGKGNGTIRDGEVAVCVNDRLPGKGPRAKGRDHRVPFPEDFTLTDTMREQALHRYPDCDVEQWFELFRAHHIAHGKAMRSWCAAWITWIGNGEHFGYPRRPGAPSGIAARAAQADALQLQALKDSRAELGLSDFREPYAIESADAYRTALSTEITQRGLPGHVADQLRALIAKRMSR